jgi:chaperonin GroEL (HSP60 family)
MAIANIVRTSLGPLGLDKMLVDDIGVSLIYFLSLKKILFRMSQSQMMELRFLNYLTLNIQLQKY